MAALRGKNKQALRHYQAAARLAPDRAAPHAASGSVLLKMGKAKDAVAAYERAAERASGDRSVLGGLAEALHAAGRREEADGVRQRIAELAEQADTAALSATQQEAGLPRAEMLHLAGHQARLAGRPAAAIDAWLDAARSYADEGYLDAALDACHEALTLAGGAARIHVELARLYFLRGWQDLAVERLLLLRRLLDVAPQADVSAAVAELIAEHATADTRLAALAGGPPAWDIADQR